MGEKIVDGVTVPLSPQEEAETVQRDIDRAAERAAEQAVAYLENRRFEFRNEVNASDILMALIEGDTPAINAAKAKVAAIKARNPAP